ncbi:MAG TPA: heme exporter protein CcmD [Stellaceae bacterium]|nr:heme exporter protein CcmD [Stellaceae bacterium]
MTSAIARWLAMGGYAVYVWPAYGVTCLVLGGLVLYCWQRHRHSSTELARLQQQLGRRE